MTIVYLLLVALGCLVLMRAVTLLFFSEVGRKHDLIKHIYKSGTDFQLAIVVPYLDNRKIKGFQDLMGALDKQDYPSARMGVHVVATEETSFGLPNAEDLPGNVKIWTYPSKHASRGQVTSWLVERLLAAGGPSKLFIFLDADDIVRPDFLRNVTTRAFDCFAMQGYLALKRPPKDLFATVWALSMRLINRIENAGRFHVGLSCRLMNSGWVVRQELLEMIPFKQGHDQDNLEYTTLLNLSGYRVNWAPNVVVYKDERIDPTTTMNEIAHSAINRLKLAICYAPQLFIQSVARLDFNLLEQAWGMMKPPHFVIGLIGITGSLLLWVNPLFATSFYYWSIFVLLFWSTQLISLAVARCSFKDVIAFIAFTPIVYGIGLALFPVFLATALAESVFQLGGHPKRARIGKRFDESQPAQKSRPGKRKSDRLIPSLLYEEDEEEISEYSSAIQSSANASARSSKRNEVDDFAALYEDQLAARNKRAVTAVPQSTEPRLTESVVPITNGRNAVNCTLKTYQEPGASGQDEYFMVFSYKTLSFTTQRYRIVDQAYYELQTKLKAKGFTMVSCGSCANFYRPTAGTGFAKDHGYCLAGKMGKQLNFDTDAVTVISKACESYGDMSHRSNVVQDWQDSLQQVSGV